MFANILSYQTKSPLSIIQFSAGETDTLEYISGSRALSEKKLVIQEITQGGSVNLIRGVNESEFNIFLMDGDILEGAKQNRVLNSSVFIGRNSIIDIPVSCVERGRWHYEDNHFRGSDYTIPSAMRAKKTSKVSMSLNRNLEFDADQSEVWENVDNYSMNFKVASDTSDLTDVLKGKKETIDELTNHFILSTQANGMAVFVNDNLLHIDIFHRKDIYQEYFAKLLRGAVSETIFLKPGKPLPVEKAVSILNSLLEKREKISKKDYPAVGLGVEKRFEDKDITGFELEFEKKKLHTTIMNLEKTRKEKNRGGEGYDE